jgi:CHAT domain-containing protein
VGVFHPVVLAQATCKMTLAQDAIAEPALALTPPDQASDGDDGLLTATEVSALALDADWVILSACNTAAGDRPNGEGLSGLARAFMFAGGSALVASHWRVPDDVAGRITNRAVTLQRKLKLARGEALQLAMREILDDEARDASAAPFSNPGIWAAFAHIGLD